MQFEFAFETDKKAYEFCASIMFLMIKSFNISQDEALGRINKLWGNTKKAGSNLMIYHESDDFWAYDIYYGSDSRWWARKNDPTLEPLPYP